MIKVVNQFDFHHTLAQAGGVSLVFFTTGTCSACRSWRQLLEDPRWAAQGVEVFMVDAEQDMALTREFEIFHLPALFIYVDGEYHCPLQAEARAGALEAAIAQALTEPAREAP